MPSILDGANASDISALQNALTRDNNIAEVSKFNFEHFTLLSGLHGSVIRFFERLPLQRMLLAPVVDENTAREIEQVVRNGCNLNRNHQHVNLKVIAVDRVRNPKLAPVFEKELHIIQTRARRPEAAPSVLAFIALSRRGMERVLAEGFVGL
eukprot:297170-Rhodomonas_salina.1